MSNLLERISKILDCTIDNVKQRLTNKCDRDRVLNEIRGKALKTNYLDRNGKKQKIYCIQFKNCYYPLELLDLVEDFDESDSDSPIIMKNLRKKASSSSESVQ
uniref:Uncharacterized protein n=1 Tax=Meloidogyne floridensis TaxID=298350 RepID=A0A915P1R7_9BILA